MRGSKGRFPVPGRRDLGLPKGWKSPTAGKGLGCPVSIKHTKRRNTGRRSRQSKKGTTHRFRKAEEENPTDGADTKACDDNLS